MSDQLRRWALGTYLSPIALATRRTRARLTEAERELPRSGVLLDVGCGEQPYRDLFERDGRRYLGLDRPASATAQRGGAPVRLRLDLAGDALSLPLASGTVACVLCVEVLEHLPDPAAAVHELNRVLRPGGYLLLAVPQDFSVHGAPHDYFRFTRFGARRLVEEAGLAVERIEPLGGLPTVVVQHVVWAAYRRLAGADTPGHRRRWLGMALGCLVAGLLQPAVALLDRPGPEPDDTVGHLVVARKGMQGV